MKLMAGVEGFFEIGPSEYELLQLQWGGGIRVAVLICTKSMNTKLSDNIFEYLHLLIQSQHIFQIQVVLFLLKHKSN